MSDRLGTGLAGAPGMLVGLVGGLVVGTALAAADPSWSRVPLAVVAPLGALFINAIRMTVVPLVVSKLVVGVASMPDGRSARRLGGSAFVLFVATVGLAAILAMAAAAPVVARLPIDPVASAGLRQDAAAARDRVASAAETLPGIGEWLVGLVPSNPIQAAVEGAMLPLIVFSLAFGMALGRVPAPQRVVVVSFFDGMAAAMLTVVRWVLAAAPVGVFALAVPLAARLGLATIGALALYVGGVALLCVVFSAFVLYPGAVLLGRVSPSRFTTAALPAQLIGFSSRSSLASLPSMIESARARLAVPEHVGSMFLPLAAAMLRPGTAIGSTLAVLFLARLYDVAIEPSTVLSIVAVVTVTSFGAPGIPSGGLLIVLPVLMTARVPAEGIGILLAVDIVPDMFRTATNVTAGMAAVSAAARRWRHDSPPS